MPHLQAFSKELIDAQEYSKIAVLVDENTHKHCYPLIKDELPTHTLIQIPSGEKYKNLTVCQQIWTQLTDYQFDRKSLLLNLGGGVIGDMGGFCAATFKRGMTFIQIPTTLLAQVDASVGGKLGVDFQGFKNHIGVFQEPEKVLIDTRFLASLPKRELRSGFAEVIKHCLIADEQKFNELISSDIEALDWDGVVAHSVEIKSQIVAQDPYEKGLRKVLNFGHTVGHAVETYFLHQKRSLLHGEAVAIGILTESFISLEKGLLEKAAFDQIQTYLLKLYGKVEIDVQEIPQMIDFAKQDKKNEAGKIQCTLLRGIGKAIFNQPVTLDELSQSLYVYAKANQS